MGRRGAAIGRRFPGLEEAQLTRLDEQTFLDIWRWDDIGHARAAAEGAPQVPEAAVMFEHIAEVVSMEHAELVRREPGSGRQRPHATA